MAFLRFICIALILPLFLDFAQAQFSMCVQQQNYDAYYFLSTMRNNKSDYVIPNITLNYTMYNLSFQMCDYSQADCQT